jgi:hypothetical protein
MGGESSMHFNPQFPGLVLLSGQKLTLGILAILPVCAVPSASAIFKMHPGSRVL